MWDMVLCLTMMNARVDQAGRLHHWLEPRTFRSFVKATWHPTFHERHLARQRLHIGPCQARPAQPFRTFQLDTRRGQKSGVGAASIQHEADLVVFLFAK